MHMIKMWLMWIGQQRWSHAILALNSDPLLLIHSLQRTASWSPRKTHQLDKIIKHHTNIHAIIHEANNRSKLEQYTNQWKRIWNQICVLLWSHRCEEHANQIYGEKDTTTKRSTHKTKYKMISFIYFNCIKAYINWIKSNLDLNYKTKVKQIIFYLWNLVA